MWIVTEAKKQFTNSNFTKRSQYKHNAELTTSTNNENFQNHMHTCFIQEDNFAQHFQMWW